MLYITTQWDELLATLPPWDLHTVFKRELEWHDNIVSGEWDMFDLYKAIETTQGKAKVTNDV